MGQKAEKVGQSGPKVGQFVPFIRWPTIMLRSVKALVSRSFLGVSNLQGCLQGPEIAKSQLVLPFCALENDCIGGTWTLGVGRRDVGRGAGGFWAAIRGIGAVGIPDAFWCRRIFGLKWSVRHGRTGGISSVA